LVWEACAPSKLLFLYRKWNRFGETISIFATLQYDLDNSDLVIYTTWPPYRAVERIKKIFTKSSDNSYFFGEAGFKLGFMQALYSLSHTCSPFYSGYFRDGV
jgi:hypothetical protein